jgi:hypothetical protein
MALVSGVRIHPLPAASARVFETGRFLYPAPLFPTFWAGATRCPPSRAGCRAATGGAARHRSRDDLRSIPASKAPTMGRMPNGTGIRSSTSTVGSVPGSSSDRAIAPLTIRRSSNPQVRATSPRRVKLRIAMWTPGYRCSRLRISCMAGFLSV